VAEEDVYKARIEITTDGKQAASELQQAIGELRNLTKEVTKFKEAQNKGAQSSKTFTKEVAQGGREYLNFSTKIDSAIEMQRKGSDQFTRSLKERLVNQQREIDQLPRLSYALYDVSNAAAGISAAFGAAAIATLKFSADFETAFTNVERTTLSTGKSLELIKTQLLNLSTEVPVAFTELAGIATIGAQLGIASSDLTGFTKNVSMFSATTNVSVEEAAKSFGALGELLGVSTSEYNKLGSAISFVGVNSVATESEILSVAKNLGGVANQAGLSAEFVIGLSGALASLRVPAEQSRGALTRVFQEINRSSIEGGSKLQAFADVLGVTVDQAKNLAQTNQQAFFQQLIQGLSSLDSGQLTAALDAMELSDIRVTNTLTRLSKNMNVVNASLADSEEAYASGTFLAQAYGYRVDDLASRFQIFQNSLQEVGAAFGEAITPQTVAVLDAISGALNGLADALRTDAGKAFASVTITTFAFVSALGAIVATGALATATSTRLMTVLKSAGFLEATTGAKAYAASLLGVGAAGEIASKGVIATRIALASLGIGVVIAALGALALAFQQTATSADDTFNRFVNDTSGLADAVQADIEGYRQARISGDQEAINSYVAIKGVTEGASQDQINYQKTLKETAGVLGVDIPIAFAASNDAIVGNSRYLGENTAEWIKNALVVNDEFQNLMNSSLGPLGLGGTVSDALQSITFDFNKFAKAVGAGGKEGGQTYLLDLANNAMLAGRITKQQFNEIGTAVLTTDGAFYQLINTVLGYVNVLSVLEVPGTLSGDLLDAAFAAEDFGDQVGGAAKQVRTLVDYANDLSSTFKRAFDIRWAAVLDADATADSWASLSKRIDEARNKVLGLTATRDRLEYFLSIAVKAGDTMRINELTAELANANSELASATDEASTELNGNSAATRRNRRELLSIIQSNAQYLTSLAASGTSQSELARIAGELNADFIDQATALGFTQDEAAGLATTFGDLTRIINTVPRNITVAANANPAIQALNEFIAQANAASATVTIKSKVTPDANAAAIKYIQALYDSKKALNLQQISVKNYAGAIKSADSMAAYAAQIKALGGTVTYATGGFTGKGGKYEPAGVVHKGEYVVPKSMVNQSTGLPYADALGRLVAGSAPSAPSYAAGGFVGAGGMMVSLSPDDRALLRGVGASGDIVVAVDSREIARANARGARLVTAEGGYLT